MDAEEVSMESDCTDDDDDDYDYDNSLFDDLQVDTSRPVDAEYFDYKLLRVDSVKQLFNESVEALDNEIAVGIFIIKSLYFIYLKSALLWITVWQLWHYFWCFL